MKKRIREKYPDDFDTNLSSERENNFSNYKKKKSNESNSFKENETFSDDDNYLGDISSSPTDSIESDTIFLQQKLYDAYKVIEDLRKINKEKELITPEEEKKFIVKNKSSIFKTEKTNRKLFSQDDSPLYSSDIYNSSDSNSSSYNKLALKNLLESSTRSTMSNKVLTDITNNVLEIVGRAKIDGTSKQLRHIIPVALSHTLLKKIVTKTNEHDGLKLLAKILVTSVKSQEGFALKSPDLETEDYENIKKNIDCSNRKINLKSEEVIFLVSPSKEKILFNTPRKKNKAKEEYSKYNSEYVEKALTDLIIDLGGNPTAQNITAQIITRLILTISNKGPNCAFAHEGNSVQTEIRLYKSIEEAENGNLNYIVVTAEELQNKFAECNENKELINSKVRIVNCEGPKIKEIIKALTELDNITSISSKSQIELSLYNDKYNLQIKLANAKESIAKYNAALTKDDYKIGATYQIAKQLYLSFDLKALDKIVFAPTRKGEFEVYNSATGSKTTKFSFDEGDEYRKFMIENSSINNDNFFRNPKKDLEILPQKLAELFFTGTSWFEVSFARNIDFLHQCLDRLIELAAIDYCMKEDSIKDFSSNTHNLYDSLLSSNTPSSDSEDSISSIELIGSDSGSQLYYE
jgi:rRNA maturation endonuclease Nob1